MKKLASVSACSQEVAFYFANYLSKKRQENRLPPFAYDGIPIHVKDSFVDPRYDVYVSLGDNKFLFFCHDGGDEFKMFVDVSSEQG